MDYNPREYLEQEIEQVIPYNGPSMKFSHIVSNDEGLREYQSEMKREVYKLWDNVDNVMLQMPTGTGKTIVFTSIVRDILKWCCLNSPDSKILILAHRKELIEQASKKLDKIPHGIIQSGKPMDLSRCVQVASVQTFMSKKNYEVMRQERFDFIIIDEAHHSMAPGYQKLWIMYPNSKKLGVTATPWRMNHSGFTSLYDEIVLSKSIEWFVNNGYLSSYDYISIKRNSNIQRQINNINRYGIDGDYLESELSNLFDRDKIRAELYKSYKQFAYGKKGIIYAIDRKHAANICSLYSMKGVKACMIDGTTSAHERENLINSFRLGEIEVIVNVNIFSEGFDCPDIEFIQLARPTKSLSLYLQQVGRALRVSDNKKSSIILDNVGLYNRFGTPMANRYWYHHFLGTTACSDDYNDGTSIKRDILFDVSEKETDYSEGDENMVVVEHAEEGKQIRDDMSNIAVTLADYNIFRKNGLYGVCDKNNRTIIPPIYEDMHPYCNGYIPYKQNGKWGIMLKNGIVKVKPKYYYIGPFIEGIAEVQNTMESPIYHINDKLEKIE
ncbi:DEAD/DEAH box helicase family protein [Phocaeicola plebeius]|uniref:DEAD/DEAH box helicase family protein n=1 Tax=Phocaeicola plebeius TaxID=310297 RepID=UPI0026F2BD6F|nr:DEAD/DEAH box helicase family protein [Phocaeicola plebeius]